MYYKIEGRDEIYEDIDDVLDYCIVEDYHDRHDDYFEEWVNDNYDNVYIAGQTYYPYDILDNFGNLCDVEEEYQERMNETDRDDAEYNLRHAKAGDEVYIQNYAVLVCEEGDPDRDVDVNIDCVIEKARQYYDEQLQIYKAEQAKQQNDEDDMMSLFQRLGA